MTISGNLTVKEKGRISKSLLMVLTGIYVPAGLLLWGVTRFIIPYMNDLSGAEPVLLWFITGGLFVFVPLIVAGAVILKTEGYKINKETLRNRLRFKPLTKKDILMSIAGTIIAGLLSGVIMAGVKSALGTFDYTPSFLTFVPLGPGRYWLLLVWFPFWILNILGEEFLWRGVMLPQHEVLFGRYAWLIQAFGWGIFHISFGWQMLLILAPLMLVLPRIAMTTKNSWTGVIMHASLNGPAFIAISMGWL